MGVVQNDSRTAGLRLSVGNQPFVTFKSDVVALSSPCKFQAVLEGYLNFYPVRSFHNLRPERVIVGKVRTQVNPDISQTSHFDFTHKSKSHFTTHFLSKKHNACLFGLYCIVLYCIVRARERFRFLLLSFYSYDSTL